MGCYWHRSNEVVGEKPVSITFDPPQIKYALPGIEYSVCGDKKEVNHVSHDADFYRLTSFYET